MEAKKKVSPPNSDRFKEFSPFPDGSGFEIPTGEKFYFEEDGGWFIFFLYLYLQKRLKFSFSL